MKNTPDWLEPAVQAISIDDDGRTCADIPESACREEKNNFLRHVVSLTFSKSADGLVDPKLVLSWLMTHLGAPVFLIGLLVPIRESGALLPQLFTAGYLRSRPQRKWVWSAGAVLQGLSALGIALSALFMEGLAAGIGIAGSLAVLAVSRSVCSVAYKDVLGKTVDKSHRGTATGLAGSLSAAVVIGFALLLTTGWIPRYELVCGALALAGVIWMLAALNFLGLKEEKGATEGGSNAITAALENLTLLKKDPQLRRFIAVRGFLIATALAPPFMIAAATAEIDDPGSGYGDLGYLLFASAFASLSSSWLWGYLADRSSRKVLMLSGFAGAIALGATGVCSVMGVLGAPFVLPVLLFGLMLAYQGVRLGRSTHLVDMADKETRAGYTALSNTIIGILLLLGGGFGLISSWTGPDVVLFIMAVMCALAGLVSFGLNEVQKS